MDGKTQGMRNQQRRWNPKPYHEIYAILWVTRECERKITTFLMDYGIPRDSIQRSLHLTVYYARRILPGLEIASVSERIIADVDETRFMVLAPGGENPRPNLEPSHRSVGIRLTKRNKAIADIQRLRESVYRLETPEVIGRRRPTSAWQNCFGARHYQPHVKLLKPGSEINRDLTRIGFAFRKEFSQIDFGRFQTRMSIGF